MENLQESDLFEEVGFTKSRAKCKSEGCPCALPCTTPKSRAGWPEVERHATDGVSGQFHSRANWHTEKETPSSLRSE